MFERICDRQSGMLEAASAGRDTEPAVANHLASCASCREAVTAVRWMRQMAEEPVPGHPLPNPDVIWWKAQLLRRWEAERRATAPIERMHSAELVAGLVSLVVFVVWQWSGLMRAFSRVSLSSLGAWTAQASNSTTGAVSSSTVFLVGSLFIGAMILAGVHRLLADH